MIGNRYGPGIGDIWLDNVHCVGNEMSIANCLHGGWGVHNCNHTEDVSVSCGTSPVHYGNFIYRSRCFASEISRAFSVMLSLAFSVSQCENCEKITGVGKYRARRRGGGVWEGVVPPPQKIF